MEKLAGMLIIASLLLGCTVTQRGFTFITTKDVQLQRVNLASTKVERNKSGSDRRFWILFLPLKGNPTLENAVNSCLDHGRGDFIINPVVKSTGWSLILISYGSWHVRGDVGNSLAEQPPEQEALNAD